MLHFTQVSKNAQGNRILNKKNCKIKIWHNCAVRKVKASERAKKFLRDNTETQ